MFIASTVISCPRVHLQSIAVETKRVRPCWLKQCHWLEVTTVKVMVTQCIIASADALFDWVVTIILQVSIQSLQLNKCRANAGKTISIGKLHLQSRQLSCWCSWWMQYSPPGPGNTWCPLWPGVVAVECRCTESCCELTQLSSVLVWSRGGRGVREEEERRGGEEWGRERREWARERRGEREGGRGEREREKRAREEEGRKRRGEEMRGG